MGDGHVEEEEPGAGEVSLSSGAEAAGALLGLGLGVLLHEPGTGAIVGAAASPWAKAALDRIVSAAIVRSRESAGHVLDLTADNLDRTIDQVVERLLGSDELLQMTVEALQAASFTTYEQKLIGLARALAQAVRGVEDGARVDEERLIILTLADLDQPHIKLLYAMSVMLSHGDEGNAPWPFTIRELQQRQKHLGRPVRALLAPMEARGCVAREQIDLEAAFDEFERRPPIVNPSGGTRYGGKRHEPIRQDARWKITPHGQEVLSYLNEVDLREEHLDLGTGDQKPTS
jgi:hypothetical protein